ncbi:MAG TPA: hypothetical protein VKD24_08185, partial [Candidatus Angelobacter sp.]|nr:hypothetical protein [Candidatus Angelobacter sp.]
MRIESLIAGALACACLPAGALARQGQRTVRLDRATAALEHRFFNRLDLGESGNEAEGLLRQDPANSVALFVRMEIAELEDRPDRVLDS